jgi:ABC-type transporter Mla subunit MlaD
LNGGSTDETTGIEGNTGDESTGTPVASTAAGGCADLDRWLAGARERIQRAGEMSLEDATLEDLDSLAEHVDEYAALAEEQIADQAPPEAEAAAKALAATLQAYSDSVDQILGANDPDKDAASELTEGMNTFNDAGTRLNEIETELNNIASECGLT